MCLIPSLRTGAAVKTPWPKIPHRPLLEIWADAMVQQIPSAENEDLYPWDNHHLTDGASGHWRGGGGRQGVFEVLAYAISAPP